MNTTNKIKFITTTLPYVGQPHIGHCFEFILGDALSRYYKAKLGEKSVLFNVGLDEHGLKVQQAAEKSGHSPMAYLSDWIKVWIPFCEAFHIKFDDFYRTSSPTHGENVQKFWKKAVERGDIYKKKYKGLYCVGCESFKVDADLEYGKCPDHSNLELQPTEEENYFFRLSKYKNDLLSWIKLNPEFLVPANKLTELTNIIEAIEDISVSRNKSVVSWAVPVPGDETQTIYVWQDALLNYVFSAGYDPECDAYSLEEFNNDKWDGALQLCGPDNLRFQAVIFQGLLKSAGIKQTHRLLVHGTILDSNGKKMSKTVGNVIDPKDQKDKYGIDAVRYYALAGLNLCENSKWDESRLVEIYNSHLADDYGNLLARTLHLVDLKNINIDYDLRRIEHYSIDEKIDAIRLLWEELRINEAIEKTNELVKEGNKKINDEKPWENDDNDSRYCLIELHYLLSEVSNLYYPVIPAKSEEAKKALQENKKVILFKKLEYKPLLANV